MDARTFDRLSKSLAATCGRRQALTAVTAGLVAVVLARAAPGGDAKPRKNKHGTGKRKTRKAKRTGQHAKTARTTQAAAAAGCQRVGQFCDEDSDCCAGAECGVVTCRCTAGLTTCGGKCVDLETAHDHCGSCNTACGANAICVGGSCIPCPNGNTICGDVCCSPYRVCCDGTCVDALYTNPDHCGACGNRCPGSCILNPDGSLDCVGRCCSEGQCVSNFRTDRNNCGACNHACRAGEDCCDGDCLDLDTNSNHCGRCGHTCRSGRVCCDGTCVDPDVNDAHCGACGNDCNPSHFDPGWSCCGGECCDDSRSMCCGDQCLSRYSSDLFNCGGCGRVCPPGASCCLGECCPMAYECAGGCRPPL